MLKDCPICAVALPEERYRQVCGRCGLTWAAVDVGEGVKLPAPEARIELAPGSLEIAFRPSAGSVVFYLAVGVPLGLGASGVIALMIAAIATDTVPCGPIGWILLIFCIPVCAAFVVFIAMAGASGLLRLLIPRRVTGRGNEIRFRLERRRIFRTDVHIPRGDLTGAVLRPWQHGMKEVWIRHRAGPAFHVAGPALLEDAAPIAAQIDAFLAAR